MFSFEKSPFRVAPDLADVCRETWTQIAGPGATWSGRERVAIAGIAREARRGGSAPGSDLPPAAVDVAALVGGTPSQTTPDWVAANVEALGEARYVETASVAARLVAIDTFTRLLGEELEPLPAPIDGEPTGAVADDEARRSRAWIRMVGFPTPPNTFSLIPDEAAAMNMITDTFYMPEFDMQYADQNRRGLHRTQIETVAGMTSHSNECFY